MIIFTIFENSENFTYFNANAAIVQSMVETGHNISLPQSQASLTYGFTSDIEERYHVYDIEYSANGNITQLKRNGNLSGSDVFMDNLSYHYLANSNQLDYVSDAVPSARYDNDIDNQSSGNFDYDLIGSMIEDAVDGLYHVKDSRGKTLELRDAQSNALLTEYTYDESGRCISIYDNTQASTTWFVRGPGGEIISVYTEDASSTVNQEEQYLYGIGRLGKASTDQNHADIVLLQYEYQDNLGNVRAVFQRDVRVAEVVAISDYYPFGMKMPDRCVSVGNYGHAYQGVFAQEDAQYSQYNRFQLRTYDNRLGRFLSPDPYGQFYSAYTGMGNNPVNLVDPSGGWVDGPLSKEEITTLMGFSWTSPNMWAYTANVVALSSDWDERSTAVHSPNFWESSWFMRYFSPITEGGGSGNAGGSISVSSSSGSRPTNNSGSKVTKGTGTRVMIFAKPREPVPDEYGTMPQDNTKNEIFIFDFENISRDESVSWQKGGEIIYGNMQGSDGSIGSDYKAEHVYGSIDQSFTPNILIQLAGLFLEHQRKMGNRKAITEVSVLYVPRNYDFRPLGDTNKTIYRKNMSETFLFKNGRYRVTDTLYEINAGIDFTWDVYSFWNESYTPSDSTNN